jgi:hypothetical protein
MQNTRTNRTERRTEERIPRRPGDRYVLKDGYTLLMRIAHQRASLPADCSEAYDGLEARVRTLVADAEAAAL